MNILIRNAKIIDGSGAPAYKANVGISDGKIVLKDLPGEAEQVIEAEGRTLTPGFIDAHSHGDMAFGTDYGDLCKLNQGVTTQIAAQCGNSNAPVSPEYVEEKRLELGVYMRPVPDEIYGWTSWSKYADYVDTLPKGLNTALFVGFNTMRTAVMGNADRPADREEIEKMQDLLREAMEHGALGMSSGLAYVPGTFADTGEVAEVAKAMAPFGGIYATHLRNESFDHVKAVKEAVEIGRRAGVAVSISHFKVMGRKNWGRAQLAVAEIEKARAEGLSVTVDQYPYDSCMTILHASMPPWYFTKGVDRAVEYLKDPGMRAGIREEMNDPECDYENFYLNAGGFPGVIICSAPKTPEAEGMTVTDFAAKNGKDPFDAFADLLIENRCQVSAIYNTIGEKDMEEIFRLPYCTVGSDGLVSSRSGMCHPRGWDSMVRAITYFGYERQMMTLEELIRKITSLPAEIYGLQGRGCIMDGAAADLVLLDEKRLRSNASYQTPTALAGGIDMVFVNGEIAYRDGALTGRMPGKLIRSGSRRGVGGRIS